MALMKDLLLMQRVNRYDALLYDYLISSEMCILNGRNALNNVFTSILENGLAIVGHGFVPNE